MIPGLPVSVPGIEGTEKLEERPQLYVSGAFRKDSRWSEIQWTEFPNRYQYSRASVAQAMPLIPEFVEAVCKTRERFWVIDSYFFAPDMTDYNSDEARQYYGVVADILLGFADNSPKVDIRILTSQCDHLSEFWSFVQEVFGDKERRKFLDFKKLVKISMELDRGAPAIHDRFAILDETLWHFGAKVGGLHPSLSANSGAWSAEGHCATGFFEKVWDLCWKPRG